MKRGGAADRAANAGAMGQPAKSQAAHAAPPPPAATPTWADLWASGDWARRGSGTLRDVRQGGRDAIGNDPPATPVLAPGPAHGVAADLVDPFRIRGTYEVVFVDGHHVSALDRTAGLRRGLVRALSTPGADQSDLVELHLGRHAGDQGTAALNAAFLQDGAVVDLQPHESLDAPLHLLHVATGGVPASSHVRHLIVAGSQSEATVIESWCGVSAAAQTLTTAVTEIVAGQGARLRRAKLQRESLHATHLGATTIVEDRDANVHDTLLSIGAAASVHELRGDLASPGCEIALDGLFLATGDQSVSMPTSIDHAVPHTTSHELYKGVLDGAARGSFVGSVKVRADAQKTNSDQQNRNLLLSPGAKMATTPQLEIHADDVKCSHGSTIGQLSKDALFFLRARGIDAEAGRLLLTKAFAHEVIARAPAPVQPLMDALLTQWFACRKVQETRPA